MTPLFADTSYFIALVDTADDFHQKALAFSLSDRRRLLLTSAIIQELGAAFSSSDDRHLFRKILKILNAGNAEILHVDAELQQRGITLFQERPDKDWSLTDCISFVVMTERGLTEAATTDHHFEEARFKALLRGGK